MSCRIIISTIGRIDIIRINIIIVIDITNSSSIISIRIIGSISSVPICY